jgi:hypothetical protein
MSKVKRGTISLSTLQDPDKQPEMIAITPISMMISEPQPIKKTRTRSRRSGDPIAEENNVSLSKSKSTSNKSEKRHRSPSPKKTKKKLTNDETSLSFKPINNVAPTTAETSSVPSTKPKKTKEILYEPLFEAANLITDEYWKNYFLEMSKGKSKKVYVDASSVSYTFKRQSFMYMYKDKSPEEIAVELKRIINNTMMIFSDTDMISEDYEMGVIANEFNDAKKEDNWKKIKNRKMKDHLITRYIMNQKEKLELTWEESRRAYQTINNALFHFYTHSSDDISMQNGDMNGIDEITISKESIRNDRFIQSDVVFEKPQVKKVQLDKEWTKVATASYKSMLVMIGGTAPSKSSKKGVTSKKKPIVKGKGKKEVVEEKQVATEEEEDELEEYELEEVVGEDGLVGRVDDNEDYLRDSDEEVLEEDE